jgi:hypothetical protein
MLPPLLASSLLRDEHAKQTPNVSRAFSDTVHAPSPAGHRRNKKKTDRQINHIGSRRCHFHRLDSMESINNLVPASEENQTGENDGGARTTQIFSLDQFLEHNNRGRRSKSVKKTGVSNPSSRRTTTIRTDPNNNLQVAPLRTAPAEKDDLPKKRHSKTHAVFPQLRFEDGRADIDYVMVPLVSSIEQHTRKKKPHSAVVTQLQIPTSSGVNSLEDLNVQYVRVPLISSVA